MRAHIIQGQMEPLQSYNHSGIQLVCGDCLHQTEWLSADVLVTDPPYGMNYSSGWQDRKIEGDENTEARDKMLSLWGDRPALVFGHWDQPKPIATKMLLTWDKSGYKFGKQFDWQGDPNWPGMGDLSLPWGPSTEEIYVLGSGFVGKRTGSVIRVQRVVGNTNHPNEKPVELMERLIMACPEEWVIADPFVGSGSTLRAAKNLLRKAIGVELDKSYYDVAVRRLAQEMLFTRRTNERF